MTVSRHQARFPEGLVAVAAAQIQPSRYRRVGRSGDVETDEENGIDADDSFETLTDSR